VEACPDDKFTECVQTCNNPCADALVETTVRRCTTVSLLVLPKPSRTA
jgi:hypothetical protein